MKILIINKFLHPNGGSETYIFGLGEALSSAGHEVQYFGMEHEGRIVGNAVNSYTKELNFHGGLSKNLLTPFSILYSREARRKLRPVLESFHPDVVHLNNINFQLTPSVIDEVKAFDKDIRIIYTAHDYQWVCPNHQLRIPSTGELCDRCTGGNPNNCIRYECIHGSALRSRLGAMEYRLYRRRGTYGLVDTVICPSDFMKGMLSRHPHLKGRCVTLHNFLPEGAADAPEDDTPQGDYVLYFGRFDEEKGIRTIVKAAEALPDIPFVFAGRGPLSKLLRPVANITDVGFQGGEKLKKLIHSARFVVFPSEWYENCPYSVMEAQYAGVPVIASSCGGTPELIRDGVTGILCPAGDVSAWTKETGALYGDARRLSEMRGAAKEHARKNYDTASRYIEKLLRIYRGEAGPDG